VNFFNLLNPSGRTGHWGLLSLQQKLEPETEKIMFLGSKARPVHRADSLAAIYEAIV
jgi:hypothetical protein